MKTGIEILQNYEKKIVDLSRRNRLLKYPKNARSIEFDMTIEEFQEHFGVLNELTIDFLHKEVLRESIQQDLMLEIKKDPDEELEEEVYTPPTKQKGDKLLILLSALRLDTKRKFEEHGLHTLFLTFGKIRWKEPQVNRGSSKAVGDFDYNAPLLIIPVKIEEKRIPKKTTIQTYLEYSDITVNKVLSLLLEKEYKSLGLRLNETYIDNISLLLADLVSQMEEIFKEQKITYEYSPEIQIGQFSFYGQQIYEDLTNHEGAILDHPFIGALCTHSPISQDNLDIKTESADNFLTPESDFNVTKADSSQIEVIQKVIQGNHLNVQGPPGTGKSETIVNLISNLLARKKSVLLVCEKQVALEVVLERLRNIGLEKLCLPLFHHNGDKKVFAKNILSDREYILNKFDSTSDLDYSLFEREQKIKHLRDYANALGTVVEPLSKTLHWVHTELSKCNELAINEPQIVWRGGNTLNVTYEEYKSALRLLNGISHVCDIWQKEDTIHWKNIKKESYSSDYYNRIKDNLNKIQVILLKISKVDSLLLKPVSIQEIRRLTSLESKINEISTVDKQINQAKDITEIILILEKAIKESESFNKLLTKSAKEYNLAFDTHFSIDFDGNYIKSNIPIKQANQLVESIVIVGSKISILEEILNKIVGNKFFKESSMNIINKYEVPILINPVITKISSWSKLTSLKSSQDQLRNLNTIYSRLIETKKIFDKWAILPSDLVKNKSNILELAQRFQNRYKYFFRIIFPQYSQDQRQINLLCNSLSPTTYDDYSEIAKASFDYLKLNDNFNVLLENFSKEHLVKNSNLQANQISIILENLDILVEWFEENAESELPIQITKLVDENKENYNLLYESIQHINGINKQLQEHWQVLRGDFSENIITLTSLSKQYDAIKHASDKFSQTYETLSRIIPFDQLPIDTNEFEKDINYIDNLTKQIEKIRILNLEDYYNDKNIVSRIIEEQEYFCKLFTNIDNICSSISSINTESYKAPTLKQALEIVSVYKENLPTWSDLLEKYEEHLKTLDLLFNNEHSIQDLEDQNFKNMTDVIDRMISDKQGLEDWTTFRKYESQIKDSGYEWFLDELIQISTTNPAAIFGQSLWNDWINNYYKDNSVLKNFEVREHEKIIKEFNDLEDKVMRVNALRVMHLLAPDIRNAKFYGGMDERDLVHQSQLKQRHMPIRKVVSKTGMRLQAYKPCWMVSPLTLSSYIPYNSVTFDVVIFDEASQMRVEHALGSIARAKQVVIFGDENQLPPTSFFEITDNDEDTDDDIGEDYESILHATKEILPGADELLSYHYRSKYEELISFSNHFIYSDRLITFPNPSNEQRAVQFEYVKDGIFDGGKEGKRRNEIEAKHVIELCVKQVLDEPEKTIGIIAFSKAQEGSIRDALTEFIKKNPHLQNRLDENSDEKEAFFIKNLESVQGDERDIIFLSVGYGPDKNGNIFNRFGPLNSQNGYRRLNVAITRAKERVICVSSIKSTDINPSESARGAKLLQKYLEFAEKGIAAIKANLLVDNDRDDPTADSPFEEDVEEALINKGFKVRRQVGVSGFKIDLAIVNPNNHQEYILGIECDGASYHSSYSARVNDRIRQEILRKLGWNIYRIWSQHWVTHKEDILADIISMVT